ncbi:hypothetical protein GPALN_006682 [Globodera pallida]|nr:hypothetical protein GPALN_006682 [Globodera pallida]
MNLEKLMRNKVERQQKMKKQYRCGRAKKDVNCEVFVETGTNIALRQMLRRKDGESMLLLYNSRFHDQIEATLCWFSRFTSCGLFAKTANSVNAQFRKSA